MPLTPYDSGEDMLGMSPRLALFGGALFMVMGIVVALWSPLDGLMAGSFGLTVACWGALMSEKGPAKLLLAVGVLSGLICFGAALVQVL